MTAETKYRPEIDGLRAVAVVLVILYHAHVPHIAGFLGVDIFFVISGFVVTRSICAQLAAQRFSLKSFALRRIRRLFPALFAVVCFCDLAAALVMLPNEFLDLAKANLAQVMFVSNLYFWKTGRFGYFGDPPEMRPTLHFWSLSVEEQFYLFLPLFLLVIHHLSRKIGLPNRWPQALACGAVLLLSLMHSVRSLPYSPYYVFYSLFPRIWEFMLGVVLANLPPLTSGRFKSLACYLGLALIFYPVATYDQWTPFPGWAALPPCLGAALVIAGSAESRNLVARILATRVFVGLGTISYGLYLWHWPIFALRTYVWGAIWTHSNLSIALTLLAVLAIALLSYRYLEEPVRHGRLLKSTRSLVLFNVFAITLTLLVYWKATESQGWPQRWPSTALSLATPAEDQAFKLEVSGQTTPLGHLGSTSEPQFLLWGDSHAMALAPELNRLSLALGISGLQATRSGTPPLLTDESRPWYGQNPAILGTIVLDQVRQAKIKNVILCSMWSASDEARFPTCLEHTLSEIHRAGGRCWVIGPIPQYQVDVPRALALNTLYPGIVSVHQSRSEHYSRFKAFYAEAARHTGSPGVVFLDAASQLLTKEGEYRVNAGDSSFYVDPVHLSLAGTRQLDPILKEMLSSLPEKPKL